MSSWAAPIRRMLGEAPAQLADGLGRLVHDSPVQRLEQLMRTPARRVVLEAIFWQMPQHLDRERAAGVSCSIRWRITGRPDGGVDTYRLELEDGRPRVIHGAGAHPPRVTITVDGAELLRLATGNSDPMQAYFNGRLAITGDIIFAAKVASLFLIPRSRRQRPPGS